MTSLGRAISGYPVLPRYGKMLALSHQHNLFEYMICIVAALSVQEVQTSKIKLLINHLKSSIILFDVQVLMGKKKKWMAVGEDLLLGDPGALLNIVGAAGNILIDNTSIDINCVYGV